MATNYVVDDVAGPRPPPTGANVNACTKILVLDHDPDSLDELQRTAQKNLIEVIGATTPSEALCHAVDRDLDAALLELRPDQGQGGARLIQRLRAASRTRDLPVAVASAEVGLAHRLSAVHSGAALFLAKPVSGHDFLRVVRLLCPRQQIVPPRLLIVDQLAGQALRSTARLEAERLEVTAVHGLDLALAALEELRPDLLLLGLGPSLRDGLALLKVVRADLRWCTLPTMVQASEAALLSGAQRLFEAGADDCFSREITLEELVVRVRTRLERAALLRDEVERDGLTGLLSRRPLLEAFVARLVEADRHRATLSACMIDLDRFKWINDLHGHLVGDRVLARVGQILSNRLRSSDIRGRWGGEEFLVVFPGEEVVSAASILERARRDLAATTFAGEHGRPFRVTLSAGVSGYPVDGVSTEELIAAADRRLYRAKQRGRDQIQARGCGA